MQAARENITIVLNKLKYAGNVGAAARCAKNMGLDKICVVKGDHLSPEEMRTMAAHEAAELVIHGDQERLTEKYWHLCLLFYRRPGNFSYLDFQDRSDMIFTMGVKKSITRKFKAWP